MAPHRSRGLSVVGGIAISMVVLGQVSTSPFTPYQTPKSYSDYYRQNVQTYWRPPASSKQYLTDTYFYHRPTVSPYLNLTRSSDNFTNNYYRYVRPEIERRAAATSAGAPQPAPVAPAGGQYYNHWYSGRSALGL